MSKTWKPSLTIWTYCVAPTSPFVSGGAQLQPTPGNGIPSKLCVGPGMFGAASDCWTTVSFAFTWRPTCGFAAASRSGIGLSGSAGMLRSVAETSFLYEWPTRTRPCAPGSAVGKAVELTAGAEALRRTREDDRRLDQAGDGEESDNDSDPPLGSEFDELPPVDHGASRIRWTQPAAKQPLPGELLTADWI